MKSLFSEIFEGLEMTGALLRYDDPDDADDDGRVYDLEDAFEAELSGEMKEKYLEIITMRGKKDRETEKSIFVKGVRLGMQLMLDAILEREKMKYEKEKSKAR